MKFSFEDRLYIIQTINALTSRLFDELLFALNPPRGIIPPDTAPQGVRSKALLEWADGPTGPGLAAVDKVLKVISAATEAVNRQPKVVINQRLGQNFYFDESLGEGLSLRMMQIPAGVFFMGSLEDELERSSSEGPQHEVRVGAFFMGKYPVTQAQWRFVAQLPQAEQELRPDPSRFKGEKRPVESVSWYDAMEFCARLSAYTGRKYRLPSEAEWEYACRAGTTTPFHFGETTTTDLANYQGTVAYSLGPVGQNRNATTPIDEFGVANAFGLCDMHGNVREWCQDHWYSDYEGSPTDGSAWLSIDENAKRVLRGGSWSAESRLCRSASRDRHGGVLRSNIGLRVVCEIS